jgi:hypothetical protein
LALAREVENSDFRDIVKLGFTDTEVSRMKTDVIKMLEQWSSVEDTDALVRLIVDMLVSMNQIRFVTNDAPILSSLAKVISVDENMDTKRALGIRSY